MKIFKKTEDTKDSECVTEDSVIATIDKKWKKWYEKEIKKRVESSASWAGVGMYGPGLAAQKEAENLRKELKNESLSPSAYVQKHRIEKGKKNLAERKEELKPFCGLDDIEKSINAVEESFNRELGYELDHQLLILKYTFKKIKNLLGRERTLLENNICEVESYLRNKKDEYLKLKKEGL